MNKIHYLKDYQSPKFKVHSLDLDFNVEETFVTVTSNIKLTPIDNQAACTLDGTAELISLYLNGQEVQDFILENNQLILSNIPNTLFNLEITTKINPHTNKSLMGLYASKNGLFTQCEAEGFRKITYFFDRPDVLTRYTVTIHANKQRYPVLLSNGNLIASGDEEHGRHWVRWQDPFAKPCYLFALVVADLAVTEDVFITRSGKPVTIRFYTEKQDADKAHFAIKSLKNAMHWDENRFNLEYDLSIYMVVAVSDFNMGAMENKGLNIFNTKYVLADTRTATDDDFEGVEGVIGHEYFHNYTGNRVTCRDWFQLSLKEGLTVFRDQEFSADRACRAVRRIKNINILRTVQFPEDASPTAHPIRPEMYSEINNFYTVTVYEKGAEVVRMYHTLFGEEGFQKGIALYLSRHDGQAVTCDDFRQAMAEANQADLSQFALWYSQAGTPIVKVSGSYNQQNQTFTLHMEQSIPDTPNQSNKQPMMIPIRIGLLNKNGQHITFSTKQNGELTQEKILILTAQKQDFILYHIDEYVVPSLLRGFSAPVRLHYNYSDEDLILLMRHDVDEFVRWDALQILYRKAIEQNIQSINQEVKLPEHHQLIICLRELLSSNQDAGFIALMFQLPSEAELLGYLAPINPLTLFKARQALSDTIAQGCLKEWQECRNLCETKQKQTIHDGYDPDIAGYRRLLQICYHYLFCVQGDELLYDLSEQYEVLCTDMTLEVAVLSAINNSNNPLRMKLLEQFATQYADEALVMDKYFAFIGSSYASNTLDNFNKARQHPAFSEENPNKVRALFGGFIRNTPYFHAEDGSGYTLLADKIIATDAFNPQLASALVKSFSKLPLLTEPHQNHMRYELQRIANQTSLSPDTTEIVRKILEA